MSEHESRKNEARDGYVLGRNDNASVRLALQHYTVLQHQTWILAPNVEKHLRTVDRPKIVDVGTGSALWALDLLDRMPHAEVAGFDISDAQFPPHACRPTNLHLRVHDMFETLPPEYAGAFDLVHLRLTVGWIINRDRTTLMQNAIGMLRPGGWLQWEEVCTPEDDIESPLWIFSPDGTHRRGIPEELRRASTATKMLPAAEWVHNLRTVFENHSLRNIDALRPAPRKCILPNETLLVRWLFTELYEGLIKAGVPGAKEDFEQQSRSLDDKIASGEMYAYGWTIFLGQRSV